MHNLFYDIFTTIRTDRFTYVNHYRGGRHVKEKVRNLAEKVIAHCPVVDSLLNPTNITGEVSVGRH